MIKSLSNFEDDAGKQLHEGRVHSPPVVTCYHPGGSVPSRAQDGVGCDRS